MAHPPMLWGGQAEISVDTHGRAYFTSHQMQILQPETCNALRPLIGSIFSLVGFL